MVCHVYVFLLSFLMTQSKDSWCFWTARFGCNVFWFCVSDVRCHFLFCRLGVCASSVLRCWTVSSLVLLGLTDYAAGQKRQRQMLELLDIVARHRQVHFGWRFHSLLRLGRKISIMHWPNPHLRILTRLFNVVAYGKSILLTALFFQLFPTRFADWLEHVWARDILGAAMCSKFSERTRRTRAKQRSEVHAIHLWELKEIVCSSVQTLLAQMHVFLWAYCNCQLSLQLWLKLRTSSWTWRLGITTARAWFTQSTSTLFVEKLWTCRVSVFVSLPQVGGSLHMAPLPGALGFTGHTFLNSKRNLYGFVDVPNPKTLNGWQKKHEKATRHSEHFRTPLISSHFQSLKVEFFRFSAGAGTFISLAGDQDSERKQFWILNYVPSLSSKDWRDRQLFEYLFQVHIAGVFASEEDFEWHGDCTGKFRCLAETICGLQNTKQLYNALYHLYTHLLNLLFPSSCSYFSKFKDPAFGSLILLWNLRSPLQAFPKSSRWVVILSTSMALPLTGPAFPMEAMTASWRVDG